MKYVRFQSEDGASYGVVDNDGQVRTVSGSIYDNPQTGDAVGKVEDLTLLAPCEPTKIFCIGRNYDSAVRARGSDYPTAPVAFLKTPNSVVGPDGDIIRPGGIENFVYEGEMTVVIGKEAKSVSADDAMDYVFGYTCGNDMSVRDWQQTDAHWTRAKASDTLCPLGPWIVTDIDASDLALKARVNGKLQQDGRTSDMIFKIPQVIEYLSASITLMPGDVILTGTPLGATPVVDGDVVEIDIEGIGTLRNTIRQA
jgi:2-keto-4-pentenoate hydratase/2-oxohepta-3-ene-1,7-dioic acid hydratase in catechol pathway